MGLFDITQISYWLKQYRNSPSKGDSTKESIKPGIGGTNLSYGMFLTLSILGGFFALDHLYLRSPTTFLFKIIVNVIGLGVWWVYDMTQAIFNKEVVRVFGLGVPGVGPKGIGAGVLAAEVADEKHTSFFVYGLALLFGGLFGLDDFILGNKRNGFFRALSFITVIFAPVAIFWWIFRLYKFFFKTGEVIDEHFAYFGAPSPPKEPIEKSFLSRIPIIGAIWDWIVGIFGKLLGAAEHPIETAEGIGSKAIGIVEYPLKKGVQLAEEVAGEALGLVEKPLRVAEGVLGNTIRPITGALENVAEAAKMGAQTISSATKGAIALGEGAERNVSNLAQAAQNAVKAAEPISKMLATIAIPPSLAAVKNAMVQNGGGSSDMIVYVFLGTLSLIAVSGFVLTYRRFRQNGKRRDKNDSPPQPGTIRKADKQRSSH